MLPQHQRDRRGAQRHFALAGREPAPGDAAAEAEAVDLLGAVVADPRREHVVFPRCRRQLEALELLDDRGQPFGAFQLLARRDMLPMQQEAHEVGRGDRLDLGAQPVQRVAMNAREQPTIAPFELARSGSEAAAQDAPLPLQLEKYGILFFCDRAENFHAACLELFGRIVFALHGVPAPVLLDRART